MSAQYCDFSNNISKLIGSACQNSEEWYNSSFTPHPECIILSFGFTSCCFQIDRRDKSGKPHSKFIREDKKCILKAFFSCLVSQLFLPLAFLLWAPGLSASFMLKHAEMKLRRITFYEARKPCASHSLMKYGRLSLPLTIRANALQITCL